MAKLQEIVDAMNSPEQSLADSMSSYEKGIKLINECQSALNEVESVIKKVNPDGTEEDFID